MWQAGSHQVRENSNVLSFRAERSGRLQGYVGGRAMHGAIAETRNPEDIFQCVTGFPLGRFGRPALSRHLYIHVHRAGMTNIELIGDSLV
jgi:hypothetical protein